MFTKEVVKEMFFAYLEGYTQAKRIFVGEKMRRSVYRRTSFRGWLRTRGRTDFVLTEEDLLRWLNEYLLS